MSASHHRWFRHLIAGAAIAASAAGAGCASQRAAHPHIHMPDQSLLDPATQALNKAVSVHADQFAPRIVDSARRRITVARDILFKAAKKDRSLTPAEHDRVQTLVQQARLDARAALVKTQAGAVQNQISQLQGNSSSNGSGNGNGNGNGSENNGYNRNGSIGAPGPGRIGGNSTKGGQQPARPGAPLGQGAMPGHGMLGGMR
ncbi:DUF4398 domain-containing protein [Salinisphaera sp. LB1]|uniref:DUF4398 domain-containing protein n=1 Tax=Salinisphaera sp. LB1 TaxID=2183911 RepID=UPI000D7E8534|nr:DUF4398 domain-containing protein [Salinisphaera sp. LB1]AWN16304.1 hypothetical protein SALB1_2106 [Salinisphaera sp. LB1]